MTTTYVVGSTGIFRLTATKDGATWNLTGATVTLLLRGPRAALRLGGALASVVTVAAVITSAAAGQAEATVDTDDISAMVNQDWTFSWRVVQAPTDITSEPIPLAVVVSP